MIYEIFKQKTSPKLAVLVDPDKQNPGSLVRLADMAQKARVDFFFVGGSLLLDDGFEATIATLKTHSKIPVIIFPGNNYQVSNKADAILFLSLISGRNPEYLIGQQVVAAPRVKQAGIEVIPTGYILIEGGRISTTSYITQTVPLPADRPEIAATTALAGEMLGMKLIYLEAGSGAENPVNAETIKAVKQNVRIPIIVGGGIRTAEQAEQISAAGADVIVIGNALEKAPEVLMEISLAVHGMGKVL